MKDTNSGSADNLRLAGSDFVMNTADDTITLVRGATTTAMWYELARSNNL